MNVRLDLDVFQAQLTELGGITDDFVQAQSRMQAVLSDYWTSLDELNQFKGPQDEVLADLATAFNTIRTSFDNVSVDLRSTFENFVAADDVSAEDIRNITAELDDIDAALEGIDDVAVPTPTYGPYGLYGPTIV